MFTATLDTSVLWPSLQRDFLLSLAVEGMYRPVWSAAILEELEYAEEEKILSRGVDQEGARSRASRLIHRMRNAFLGAETVGWEGLEGTFGLPDPDDEHVVAAAVVSQSSAIITHNVKDFPAGRLPQGIEALLPSDFAASIVSLDPARAYAAVVAIAARSGKQGPPQNEDQILDLLVRRYQMDRAVGFIRGAVMRQSDAVIQEGRRGAERGTE